MIDKRIISEEKEITKPSNKKEQQALRALLETHVAILREQAEEQEERERTDLAEANNKMADEQEASLEGLLTSIPPVMRIRLLRYETAEEEAQSHADREQAQQESAAEDASKKEKAAMLKRVQSGNATDEDWGKIAEMILQ